MRSMLLVCVLFVVGQCYGAAIKTNIKGCCVVVGCANPCEQAIVPPGDTIVSGPAVIAPVTFAAEKPVINCCGQEGCLHACGATTIEFMQPVQPLNLVIVPGSSTDDCCGKPGCKQQCNRVASVCQPVFKCGVLIGWLKSKCVTRAKRKCSAGKQSKKKSKSDKRDLANKLQKMNQELKLKIKQEAERMKNLQQKRVTVDGKKVEDAKKIEKLKAAVKKASGKGSAVSAPVLAELKKLADKLLLNTKTSKKSCEQMKGLVKVLKGHNKNKKNSDCKKRGKEALKKVAKSLKAYCKQHGKEAIKAAVEKAKKVAEQASKKSSIAAGESEKKSEKAADKAAAAAAKLAGKQAKGKVDKDSAEASKKDVRKLREAVSAFKKVFTSC